jgi:hypothetical protein
MLYWRSRLTGTIPSCINKMTRLFKFDVRTNLLEGSIPKEFGTSCILLIYQCLVKPVKSQMYE